MQRFRFAVCLALTFTGLSSTEAAEPSGIFSLTQEDDGITLNIDGELFTRYLTQSGPRSVLWPVIGPTGEPMTRAYPVGKGDEPEAEDHVHHRSLWIG